MVKKKDSKTATKPVAKKVATKPTVKKAVAKPVAKKPATKTVTKKAVAKPVAKKPATKTVAKKAVAKPVAKKVVTKKPATKSVVKKATAKPVAKKPVAKKEAPKKTVLKKTAPSKVAPKKAVAKSPVKKTAPAKVEKKAVQSTAPKGIEKKNLKPTTEKVKSKKVTSSKKAKDDNMLKVLLNTTHGDIEIQLMPDKSPITVINFVKYVKGNHYDGLIFHRVINGFMIQGGGYDTELNIRDTSPSIRIESDNGLKNERGTIAMARGAEPNSATSQFFINLVDNPGLDYRGPEVFGYAVFGKVTKGLDVVDKIGSLPTTQRMQHQNIPIDTVIIKSIKLI